MRAQGYLPEGSCKPAGRSKDKPDLSLAKAASVWSESVGHRLLAQQLRAAAKKDGPGIDLEALIALVDQTYAQFDEERREMQERERELAQAKGAAESASRLKSQFLATMSHELRTPLNAILGFSEVIRDSVFGRSEAMAAKYAEYAGSIHTSGRHLLGLISEILDLSKIEAGSYVLDAKELDLRNVIKGALTIVSTAAEKAGIELRSSLPEEKIWVSGDERALRQIAINLLANAVKFTPRGGEVSVEARPVENMIELTVSDTGIGIAKENIPVVFELFRQVDSSIRRRHEGTGLGLAITKRLVELHGGTIGIESELAVGTTVRVILPPSRGGQASAAAEEEAAA